MHVSVDLSQKDWSFSSEDSNLSGAEILVWTSSKAGLLQLSPAGSPPSSSPADFDCDFEAGGMSRRNEETRGRKLEETAADGREGGVGGDGRKVKGRAPCSLGKLRRTVKEISVNGGVSGRHFNKEGNTHFLRSGSQSNLRA